MYKKRRMFSLITAAIMLFMTSGIASAVGTTAANETATRVQEIEDLRETNSETYLMSDGSYECVVYAENKYYVDKKKSLQLIDNTVVTASEVTNNSGDSLESEVLYRNAANAFGVYFSDNETKNVTIEYEERKIKFSPINSTKAVKSSDKTEESTISIGQVNNCSTLNKLTATGENTVTYPAAFANTDIVYVLENNALKEYIILNNRHAPNVFSFLMTLDGVSLRSVGDSMYFIDDRGEDIFSFQSLFAIDAKGILTEDLSYSFTPTTDVNNIIVTITLDKEYFLSNEREFPIVIDPTVMISSVETADACVCSGYPNRNYKTAVQLRTGYDSDNGKRRSYIKFNIPNSVPVGKVTKATLDIEKISGVAPTIRAYLCAASWSSGTITWNNKPSVVSAYKSTLSTPYKTGSAWYTMNVTSIVRMWVNGRYNNNGFMLQDSTETDPDHWTTFYSSDAESPHKPELHITYSSGAYKFYHYYDSSFTSARQNQISAAVAAVDSAYNNMFRFSFSTKGTPQLASSLTSGAHKDIISISNTLNSYARDNNEIKVFWTDYGYGTYCSHETGSCKPFDALAAVYKNRPVIHITNLVPDGGSSNYYKACMALLLMHETAHTFDLDDRFDISSHSASGMQCVMDTFSEGKKAYDYYTAILDETQDAFCATCRNDMIDAIS